ncbi:hypothetical protein CWE08_08635 [Aliidiomarina iranensis]|uniref:YCII-related domain-containing protein n=1 Tax=Aliidiomarina iranensis TaxID=1434071 RepID=A0A432VU55_9GAMM|nr:YciI family protein [Aliidiomarina iranensis]RUO19973.1 hypothetical protein CWE08_08635 [Aliidiomarina iranensis]
MNNQLIKIFLMLVLLSFPIAGKAENQKPIELPTEWDSYYVVLVKQGPNFAELQGSEGLRALMFAHIQYQLGLQKDGIALSAGGFAEAKEGIAGLTILRASSLEEAEQIAHADPAVKAGRFAVVVYQWYVPGGSLGE